LASLAGNKFLAKNVSTVFGDENLTSSSIGVREGILLGGRKKFALKLTICPKNRQLALKL